MGRKLSASKNKGKAPMPEYASTSMELLRLEWPGGKREPSSKKVGSKHENPCPSLEGFSSPQSEPLEKSAKLRKRNSKNDGTVLRRSQRIKNASNQDFEIVDEHLTVSDNENDEPDNQVEKVLPEPKANSSEQGLEEKVDCLLQRLEVLEKLIESLQSKVDDNIGFNESSSSAPFGYRRMYTECQKKVLRMYNDYEEKIEALRNENRQLTRKLERALGKI